MREVFYYPCLVDENIEAQREELTSREGAVWWRKAMGMASKRKGLLG
jgi:hypothetical protein